MNSASTVAVAPLRHDWESKAAKTRLRRRYGADRRLQIYGLSAIGMAILLLVVLFFSIMHAGYLALTTTKVNLVVNLDSAKIDPSKPAEANYRNITRDAFLANFPEVTDRAKQADLAKILTSGAQYIVRDFVVANPDKIGQTVTIPVAVSDPFDQLHKGIIPRQIDALGADRIALFENLKRRGVLSVEDGRGFVQVEAYINPQAVPEAGLAEADFRDAVREALRSNFISEGSGNFEAILADNSADVVKSRVVADPSLVGKAVQIKLPLAEIYDQLLRTGEAKMRNPRFKSDDDYAWFDKLVQSGLISTPFTWELFVNSDSRFPETAGLASALWGSFYAILICFLLSFPIGIGAAVYLEEFAPKNRWTDIIEVNINNLAAVPSIVFGLLGLAVFIGLFGLPRSVPIVGGMVLTLMTLPTIIVATRAALKSVPPSIREAALGVGASKHQVMLHHVVPLAMPGILTGTIIGLARALGETAPLLLIGMNAFIPSADSVGLLQPAMTLPTQIYSWAGSPERGFVSRTSAAILVLLGFLLIMNMTAVFLRRKFERKW